MALAEGKLTLKKMYVVTQLLPGVFGHAGSSTRAPGGPRNGELQSSEFGSNNNWISEDLRFQSGIAIVELIRTAETNRASLPRASSLPVETTSLVQTKCWRTCQCLDIWSTSKERRRCFSFCCIWNSHTMSEALTFQFAALSIPRRVELGKDLLRALGDRA